MLLVIHLPMTPAGFVRSAAAMLALSVPTKLDMGFFAPDAFDDNIIAWSVAALIVVIVIDII